MLGVRGHHGIGRSFDRIGEAALGLGQVVDRPGQPQRSARIPGVEPHAPRGRRHRALGMDTVQAGDGRQIAAGVCRLTRQFQRAEVLVPRRAQRETVAAVVDLTAILHEPGVEGALARNDNRPGRIAGERLARRGWLGQTVVADRHVAGWREAGQAIAQVDLDTVRRNGEPGDVGRLEH